MQELDLTIRTVRTLADVEAISAEWRALETRSIDPLSYFQTYSWCRNWIARFGTAASRYRPIVQTAWSGTTLVAVLPLMLTNSWGIRRIVALGDPHTQYCNAICAPDHADGEAVRLLLAHSLEATDCDLAVFRSVPQSSQIVAALGDVARIPRHDNEASVLDLSTFGSAQDYMHSLGKVQRRHRNRRRNHLARLGPLSFEVVWPGQADFAPLLAQVIGMKRRWLKETGRYSAGFSIKGFGDFLASLSGDRDRMEGACISVLRAGDRAVAGELGFIHKGSYAAYIGGFDWELRDHSPGKVQMEMTVCWLIENGITAYDLLANPAAYKKSWSNTAVRLAYYAAPLNWKGWLYLNGWLQLLPTIKTAYAALSKRLHRLMIFGQSAGYMLLWI